MAVSLIIVRWGLLPRLAFLTIQPPVLAKQKRPATVIAASRKQDFMH